MIYQHNELNYKRNAIYLKVNMIISLVFNLKIKRTSEKKIVLIFIVRIINLHNLL